MPPFKLTADQKQANSLLAGPQRHTLLRGGSRSGKTFLLTRAVATRALRGPGSRHAILRFRGNAARASIALDTLPKVMRACFPGVPMKEHRQDGFFSLPNGSEIWIGGLDDKERVEKILGQEYATLYFNECSQIPYGSVLIGLTRLAQKCDGLRQRAYYDMNPSGTGHWTHSLFLDHRDPASRQPLANPDDYATMVLNPVGNAENLDPAYLESLANLPERQRKRFYEGEYQAEVEGALWTYEVIDRNRVAEADLPDLRRVVVAVDPSGAGDSTDDGGANDIGIVVAGLGSDDHAYVLADYSLNAGPKRWGEAAVQAYHRHAADRIIGERNFGGEMVRFVIRTAGPNVPVHLVTASRGKSVRAEPISSLYEQDKVHHVGRFPALEEQMCAFSTLGYTGSGSPDRADAAVWALTDLMTAPVSEPRIRAL